MRMRFSLALVAVSLLSSAALAQTATRSKAEQDRISAAARDFSLDLPPGEDASPPVAPDPQSQPDDAVAPSDVPASDNSSGQPADDLVPSASDPAGVPAEHSPVNTDGFPPPIVISPGALDAGTSATSMPAGEVRAPEPAASPFSLDTPIADLIADPRAKAVLDKNLPGLSADANLDKFRLLSLRKFQPLTGGQLTEELLASTGKDLEAIPPRKPLAKPELEKGR